MIANKTTSNLPLTTKIFMSKKRALIVEDDPKIAELVAIHLKDLMFKTVIVGDGMQGLQQGLERSYDLIVLDIMLPSMDGIEVCRQLRSNDVISPIIMLTAKSEEIDKVLGLETGADDYITKPFSVRELQARVKAVVRRSNSNKQDHSQNTIILTAGELSIDLDRRIVTKDNQRLDLTPKEFDLLSLMASKPGKSFNRQELLNLVWGYDFVGFEHTVNSHINRLRAKIEPDMTNPIYILTTWGYGYRFNESI